MVLQYWVDFSLCSFSLETPSWAWPEVYILDDLKPHQAEDEDQLPRLPKGKKAFSLWRRRVKALENAANEGPYDLTCQLKYGWQLEWGLEIKMILNPGELFKKQCKNGFQCLQWTLGQWLEVNQHWICYCHFRLSWNWKGILLKSIVCLLVFYLMCVYVQCLQRLGEGTRSPGLE